MTDFAKQRERMVDRQLRRRGIGDERVLAAMGAVPRELFVEERLRRRAYADGALPTSSGQTISQPWVVAAITEALELSGDERVLEIGTGSGYSTAILARLAADVVSIERNSALAGGARERLGELGVANV
ncbi:MAG TPA: rRNA adenine N-6-methyltransferase family protein, partial [Solirubrobacterales bacterium]|nr:rRNA adenine N-6-methyltransferase family protein [Solirubrobacterales bacterium]